MREDRTAGPPPAAARLEAVVRGRVQGVGYRLFIGRAAIDRGLVGWVANESDGSVRTVAEGPRDVLEGFLRELAIGPPAAWVDRVDVSWQPAAGGLDGFAIRSGWHSGD